MYLQVIEVNVEAVDADGLHPAADAADQARGFVGGEVEAAVLPEILDDCLEVPCVLPGRHRRDRTTRRFSAAASLARCAPVNRGRSDISIAVRTTSSREAWH